MNIQLSEHFNYRKLLRFTFPSMVMMMFTSIYGVVDGVFVSNFVGSQSFAAVNLIMPFLMILGAIGFMVGTGGSALVACTLGMGHIKRANEIFSMLVYVVIAVGLVLTVGGILALKPVCILLGADETLLSICVRYGRIVLLALVPFMLQNVFQSFLVTAERPHFGLYITVAAGLTNMFLDAFLIAGLKMGVEGAALATAISQSIGGLVPLLYFILPNKSRLHLGKTRFELQNLLKTCANGSSEFMTNISMSLVTMVYNWQLMKIMGTDGVTIYGIIMYVNFIFVSVFLGYSIGSAPIIGYHYGAGNREELKGLLKKSICLILIFSLALTGIAELFARPLSAIFVGYNKELLAVAVHAFSISALSFLFSGFNIFASSFFTALNDGLTSALISFGRTLVFEMIAVLVLPVFFGANGIWSAVAIAEIFACLLSVFFYVKKKDIYHYV